MTLPPDSEFFDQILKHLELTRGFDFTAYKRVSLMRRVARRMQVVGVPTFEQYLDVLRVDSDEFTALFNSILINVTSFFRDREVWDTLANEILPGLLARRRPDDQFRVWSAGCASGQEAYSIVMLLAELLGPEVVREHVKVYATDVDEEALVEARGAVYAPRHVQDVPPELLDKYFERTGDTFVFNRDLRRSVIFAQHDLVQDAPISRVDLLICRNTLMYFNADAQERILARFSFSLNPAGLLLLGRPEMLFSHTAMFVPLDLERRVFRAVRPIRDLELSYPPVALRPSLDRVRKERREVTLTAVPATVKLQSTNEELETTNEELQSMVEELETTNEELQSTNEELETMNEELQSTNEELQAANERLRRRSGDLTA